MNYCFLVYYLSWKYTLYSWPTLLHGSPWPSTQCIWNIPAPILLFTGPKTILLAFTQHTSHSSPSSFKQITWVVFLFSNPHKTTGFVLVPNNIHWSIPILKWQNTFINYIYKYIYILHSNRHCVTFVWPRVPGPGPHLLLDRECWSSIWLQAAGPFHPPSHCGTAQRHRQHIIFLCCGFQMSLFPPPPSLVTQSKAAWFLLPLQYVTTQTQGCISARRCCLLLPEGMRYLLASDSFIS